MGHSRKSFLPRTFALPPTFLLHSFKKKEKRWTSQEKIDKAEEREEEEAESWKEDWKIVKDWENGDGKINKTKVVQPRVLKGTFARNLKYFSKFSRDYQCSSEFYGRHQFTQNRREVKILSGYSCYLERSSRECFRNIKNLTRCLPKPASHLKDENLIKAIKRPAPALILYSEIFRKRPPGEIETSEFKVQLDQFKFLNFKLQSYLTSTFTFNIM